jgi:hypothetical protein
MERLIGWLIIYAILWHTGLLHVIVMFITGCMALVFAILVAILELIRVI